MVFFVVSQNPPFLFRCRLSIMHFSVLTFRLSSVDFGNLFSKLPTPDLLTGYGGIRSYGCDLCSDWESAGIVYILSFGSILRSLVGFIQREYSELAQCRIRLFDTKIFNSHLTLSRLILFFSLCCFYSKSPKYDRDIHKTKWEYVMRAPLDD